MIGGCLVFDEPDLIDTPRSFPITSGPLSKLFIMCCIENIERCEISFAFWRLGGGFKIYCDTWGGVWGRTNGHLGATTPTPCVVIIVIFVITIILVIIIIRYFKWLLNIIFSGRYSNSRENTEYVVCIFQGQILPNKVVFNHIPMKADYRNMCMCMCMLILLL